VITGGNHTTHFLCGVTKSPPTPSTASNNNRRIRLVHTKGKEKR